MAHEGVGYACGGAKGGVCGGTRGGATSDRKATRNDKCYNCGGIGHWAGSATRRDTGGGGHITQVVKDDEEAALF
jgi:hypothetical protein